MRACVHADVSVHVCVHARVRVRVRANVSHPPTSVHSLGGGLVVLVVRDPLCVRGSRVSVCVCAHAFCVYACADAYAASTPLHSFAPQTVAPQIAKQEGLESFRLVVNSGASACQVSAGTAPIIALQL